MNEYRISPYHSGANFYCFVCLKQWQNIVIVSFKIFCLNSQPRLPNGLTQFHWKYTGNTDARSLKMFSMIRGVKRSIKYTVPSKSGALKEIKWTHTDSLSTLCLISQFSCEDDENQWVLYCGKRVPCIHLHLMLMLLENVLQINCLVQRHRAVWFEDLKNVYSPFCISDQVALEEICHIFLWLCKKVWVWGI